MAGGFFHLRCAHDLLDKLGRDYARLTENPSADTLFDFFVTAWSISDWIKKERSDLHQAVSDLYQNRGPLFHCREIGNKAKHFVLTSERRKKPDPEARIQGLGGLNSSAFNTEAFNEGRVSWQLAYNNGVEVADVFHYAGQTLEILRAFFEANRIESLR